MLIGDPQRVVSMVNNDDSDNNCTIPGPVRKAILNDTVIDRPEHEEKQVREYIESEANETVTFLEKVKSERIFGRRLDAWNVHTDKNQWWVITEPTNLYSQKDFPSLDYTITFHVGLSARMASRQAKEPHDEQADRLAAAWRRWTRAVETLEEAEEAEDFQAVGMKCRECLIAMVRSISSLVMVPEDQDAPKAADVIHWSELISDYVAHGSSAKEIRSYLKGISKASWQLVNWLTHASNAVKSDGQIAVDATGNVLSAYGGALIRFERGLPDRCPSCSSYQLTSVYEPELETEPPYLTLCERCGWSEPQRIVS
jgi:hypothetical protein